MFSFLPYFFFLFNFSNAGTMLQTSWSIGRENSSLEDCFIWECWYLRALQNSPDRPLGIGGAALLEFFNFLFRCEDLMLDSRWTAPPQYPPLEARTFCFLACQHAGQEIMPSQFSMKDSEFLNTTSYKFWWLCGNLLPRRTLKNKIWC